MQPRAVHATPPVFSATKERRRAHSLLFCEKKKKQGDPSPRKKQPCRFKCFGDILVLVSISIFKSLLHIFRALSRARALFLSRSIYLYARTRTHARPFTPSRLCRPVIPPLLLATRDVIRRWPTGSLYRAAMEPYIQTMKAAFPKAELALVGHEFHGGRSAVAWNEEVFNSTTANYTGLEAHAATVHIYTIVKSAGINNATLSYRAPELLQSSRTLCTQSTRLLRKMPTSPWFRCHFRQICRSHLL